jgi:glutaminase
MIVHATIVVAQDKAQSYIERTLGNDFIPLAIETYGCLHPHFDSFLTSYVHACITCHQQTSLVASMFIFHSRQQVLIALQHA